MYTNILLTSDGSELSETAIRTGIAFAKSINAKVTGFYAEHKPSLLAYGAYAETGDVDTAPPSKDELEHGEENAAKQFLAVIEAAAKEAGVVCECFHHLASHPYEAIIKAAEEKGCDLIVLVSHPLIVSETGKVLTHTKIPVLVYR